MEEFLVLIAASFGVDVATLLAIVTLVVTISNLIGRAIPDSATGWLGMVRKVAKTIGLYLGNKLTPSVNSNDVTRAVASEIPDASILRSASELSESVKQGTAAGNVAGGIADELIGRVRGLKPSRQDGAGGQTGTVVPDEFRTDGPFQAAARRNDGE